MNLYTSGAIAMQTAAPRVSPQLRQHVVTLKQDAGGVVERICAVLMKLDGYSTLAPSARDDVKRSVTAASMLWFEVLITGKPPSMDALKEVGGSVRRRVYQRIPLQALLSAYKLGSREIWRTTVQMTRTDAAVADELLTSISEYVFDYFDGMEQIIKAAYAEEESRQLCNKRESMIYQLHAAVFNTPQDEDAFMEAVYALALDPTLPRIAIAIISDSDWLDSTFPASESHRILISVSKYFGVNPESLVQVSHLGHIVVWIPYKRGLTINQCDVSAFESARHFAAASQEIRSIGIGLLNHGALGWATSATEAIRALELAPKLRSFEEVQRYSRVALAESVRDTPNVLRYLMSISEELTSEPHLLNTLSTFLSKGQRRKPTADSLHIHPNTLTYRLARIEKLLGISLGDAEWIAKLDIAVRLQT